MIATLGDVIETVVTTGNEFLGVFGGYEIYIPIILMLVFLAIGVPIAFSMAISGTLGLAFIFGLPRTRGVLTNVPHSETTVFVLTTIPLFVLMAELINESGLTTDVFYAGQRWLAHIPGGLAIATTLANGGFAVLSGSSSAAAASMSAIAVPEMQKLGYKDTISMGTVSAAGTFAVMLPPSIALIFYGVWTETSIGALFLAGIIPGGLTLIGYILVIRVWAHRDPSLIGEVRPEAYPLRERISTLGPIWPAGIIVIAVIGGIYSGVVTASEAGAVGAVGAFLVGVGVYGLRLNGLNDAFTRAARISVMIFFIIIGAVIFTRYMAFSGITREIIGLILAIPAGPWIIILLILAVYVMLGTFMDQIAVLILTLPVTFPLFVVELGYSPVWFGIILIKTVEIGLVTPPLGMNVYIASGVVDVDVRDAFRGAAAFLTADFVVLAIMLAFPGVVMYLPDLMMG